MGYLPYKLAGVEGLEPSVAVLETAGLPLTDTPMIASQYERSECGIPGRNRTCVTDLGDLGLFRSATGIRLLRNLGAPTGALNERSELGGEDRN